MVVKKLGHDEVKQGPQLSHRILDWCTREKEPVPSVKVKERLPSPTSVVLDRLGFVEDHVVPLDSLESHLIFATSNDEIVGGNQDMDSHSRVVEVLGIKELGKLLSFFC